MECIVESFYLNHHQSHEVLDFMNLELEYIRVMDAIEQESNKYCKRHT